MKAWTQAEARGCSAALAMILATVAPACASEKLPPPPLGVGATTSADVTAGMVEHHRYHHHGGVTLLVAMSIDTLAVSTEQQPAIARIRESLRVAMATARRADRALLEALADGVTAGHLDPATVDAVFVQVGDENAKVYATSVAALNELHGVLTTPQRRALFDKVAWHWAIWQAANDENVRDNDWVATIVENLGLTTDQAAQAHAGFETRRGKVGAFDAQELTASLSALSEAFQRSDFDASSIPAASVADRHMATWGAQHLAYLVEGADPVLSPEQRALLAKTLREHAGSGGANGRAL